MLIFLVPELVNTMRYSIPTNSDANIEEEKGSVLQKSRVECSECRLVVFACELNQNKLLFPWQSLPLHLFGLFLELL
jgi:hypothetical protein